MNVSPRSSISEESSTGDSHVPEQVQPIARRDEADIREEKPPNSAPLVLSRTTSRRSSLIRKITTIQLDESKIVPRGKRRGPLSQLCLLPEYTDARDLPNNLRFFFVFVIAFVAMVGPMGTSILYPASDDAIADLDTTVSVFNVAVGIYLVTLGVIPMWWSNFSERHGRRTIYLISFALYTCFSIGCSLSKNVNQLIGFRVLSGGCAASVQAVGAGTISDMYPPAERGTAMGIFYLGPLAGPLLAPIIGGALTSKKSWGWRSTQWFLVILGASSFLLILCFLPETLRKQESKEAIREILRKRRRQKKDVESRGEDVQIQPNNNDNNNSSTSSLSDSVDEGEADGLQRIVSHSSAAVSTAGEEPVALDPVVPLSRVPTTVSFTPKKTNQLRLEENVTKAQQVRDSQNKWTKFKYYFKIYGWGPLKSFVFLRYPPALLSILYSAPCFAALYVLNMSLTYCYSRPTYNFNAMQVGLVYIPNGVAYFFASVVGGKFSDYLLKKKIEKYGVVAPEARFGINVYSAAVMLPCSLLIAGWCLDKHEHWVTPLVGTALFGFAQMIVIGITMTYLADCLPGRGATGVAINNFIRQLMAAGVSFATAPLIGAIGVGPLFSICAGVTALLSVILVILKKKGDFWRETYDLEKLYDIVDD